MADTWTTKTAMPGGSRYLGGGGQSAIGTDTAYAVAGYNGSELDRNEEYSQSGDSWTSKTVMTAARRWGATTSIGTDKLYYFGGYPPSNNNYEYSKSGNSWSSKTVVPASASETCAGTIGADKAYYFQSNNTREYSQSGDSWTSKTSSDFDHTRYQSVFEPGSDKLIVCQGFTGIAASPYFTPETKEYDQSGDSWTNKTNTDVGRAGSGNGQVSNKGYVYGGGSTGGGAGPDLRGTIDYTREYDPSGDSWAAKANMPGNRQWMGSAALGTYYTYAFGGYKYVGSYYDTNYEYTAADPPTYDALEDLQSFLDAQWLVGLEDLKAALEAVGWSLEDLKSDVRAQAYTALEDLRAELSGNVWGFEDLKTLLDGHAQALEDFRTDIATSNLVSDGLRCELKTRDAQGPYVFNYPSPAPGQTGVPVNTNITIVIRDDGWGVDIDSVWVDVTDTQTGTTTRYKKGDAEFSYTLSVNKREATITIDPATDFEHNRPIEVKVFALDLAGNPGLAAK
ncbi:MAG: hypothetical protein ACE5IC_09000 [Candidatus Brocadiales bacterium]